MLTRYLVIAMVCDGDEERKKKPDKGEICNICICGGGTMAGIGLVRCEGSWRKVKLTTLLRLPAVTCNIQSISPFDQRLSLSVGIESPQGSVSSSNHSHDTPNIRGFCEKNELRPS